MKQRHVVLDRVKQDQGVEPIDGWAYVREFSNDGETWYRESDVITIAPIELWRGPVAIGAEVIAHKPPHRAWVFSCPSLWEPIKRPPHQGIVIVPGQVGTGGMVDSDGGG